MPRAAFVASRDFALWRKGEVHGDLAMIARLEQALIRARAVPLAA